MKRETSYSFYDRAEELEAIAREATERALRLHKKLGRPIYVLEDGKVVRIAPEDIQVSEDGPINWPL